MSLTHNKRDLNTAGFSDLECDRLRIKRTRIEAGTRDRVYLTLPISDGELALTSSIPVPGTFVTVGAPDQTITSIKTFSAPPDIASFTNGASTLTAPSSTGVLALVSDIPTDADYVDTTTGFQQAAGKHWLTATQMDDSLNLTSGNVSAPAGTAGFPSYAIGGSSSGLGMYSGGTQQLNFACSGSSRFQLLSSLASMTVRLLINQAGSNSAVAVGCNGSQNEGIYFNTTTNTLNLADGSTATDVCRIAGVRTPVQTTNPGLIVAPAGSSSAASLRLGTDAAAGWYSSGSNQWTYTSGVTPILTLSSTGANLNNSLLASTLIANPTVFNVDTTDQTKRIAYASSGAATGTTLTLASTLPAAVNHTFAFTAVTSAITTTLNSSATINRTITFPNATCTMASTNVAQTISATKTFTAQQNFDTGGIRIGGAGTVRSIQISGTVATSVVLAAGANGVLATLDVTSAGFAVLPFCLFTMIQPSGGSNNWDRVLLSLDTQNSSATQVQITGVNTAAAGSTSGTASIDYVIWT